MRAVKSRLPFHKLNLGPLTTVDATIARAASAQAAALRADIDSILKRGEFDEAAVRRLASRDNYPTAAQILVRRVRQNQAFIHALIEQTRAETRLYRLAVDFHAVNQAGGVPPSAHRIRTLARGKGKRAAAARLACAAAGDLTATWSDAPEQERAAYLLGRLVAFMRGRA